jgi:uncharacterized protein (TIGR02646 family)
MKWILKKTEPSQLAEWRSRNKKDINFDYDLMRKDHKVVNAVVDALLEEQGYLCAYTGVRIDKDKCHIEHLKPQTHCNRQETVMYTNIVACFPEPNRSHRLPFGAQQKDQWPDSSQEHLFISPLDPICETRFFFDLKGNILFTENDEAAETTIKKLGLDHKYLIAWRRAEIQGVIGKNNDLPLSAARRRLNQLKARKDGPFEQFCFVLIQALEKHIKRVEKIAKYGSKSRNNKK